MTQYLRVERPAGRALPVVVSVPHAGERVPSDIPGDMALDDRVLRRDLDLYTDKIWCDAHTHGATVVVSEVSRYVVDLNRASDDVSPQTVAGARRVQAPGYYQERGVVWRTATDGTPIMRRAMTRDEFDERIDRFWRPYHDTLREEVERVRDDFGHCVLLDGHSMPSLGRSSSSRPGRRRADIVPGDAEGTSCDRQLLRSVVRFFQDRGYSVEPNRPYKGGWITRNYGRPEAGIHAIQIEVNRDLYMNEKNFEPKETGLQRLADQCSTLVEHVGDLSF